jgi:hypothetical protein
MLAKLTVLSGVITGALLHVINWLLVVTRRGCLDDHGGEMGGAATLDVIVLVVI